jgi:hypothetical protein
MGQVIETFAVADAVRTTLDMFLHDHPELEHSEVEVAEHTETDDSFGITIDGFAFEVTVRAPADA